MIRRVLVEFELDPTEYTFPGMTETLPDTQEMARKLVEAMTNGEADICKTRMVGDLVLLFRGNVTMDRSGIVKSHQEILAAIASTLQRFMADKPFQKVQGPISITALPPVPGQTFYQVSVWRAPSEVLTPEPPVKEVDDYSIHTDLVE